MEPAAWLEAARARYLHLRGSGLVLSPLDAERLCAWRDRGWPLDLVLRGLELAHASWIGAGRANARRPFPLWAAERHVEELASGWERRTPSGPPAPPVAPRVAALDGRTGAPGPASAGSRPDRAPQAGVQAHRASPDASRALLEEDEAVGIAYLVALPRHERADVVSDAMRRAGPRRAATRPRYRAMLRAVLAEAAYRRGGITRPSDR